MKKFEFSKDGLSVSYRSFDDTVFTRSLCVNLNTGENFDSSGMNAHRVDDLSVNQHRYIQKCLDKMDLKDDVQTTGNKVCEIYWGMIV